jgi:hypothetical protein
MTKRIAICAVVLCASLGIAGAQPPAPPPPGAAAAPVNPATISGTISQLNYGPDGSMNGFIVSRNTLVYLPRDWALRLESVIRPGERVAVTGQPMPAAASEMQILDAQSLRVAGKTFSLPQPDAFAPCVETRRPGGGPAGPPPPPPPPPPASGPRPATPPQPPPPGPPTS